MDNYVNKSGKYYFKSKNINIFPCAYRGTYTNQAKQTVAFQASARATTEQNLTNLYAKLGKTDSYVISLDQIGSGANPEYLLKLLLKGYYCEITLTRTDILDLTSKYFKLNTKVINYDSSLTAETTTVLGQDIEGAIILDKVDGNSTQIDDYYFVGIEGGDSGDGVMLFCETTNSLDFISGINNVRVNPILVPIYEVLRVDEGRNSIASGVKIATDSCNATGDYAVSLGRNNTVTSRGSTAIGEVCTVTGKNSAAIGLGLTTNVSNQFVIGKYNAVADNAAVVVGNGTASKKHNLVTIATNGDIILDGKTNNINIGTNSRNGSLNIANTTNIDKDGNITAAGSANIANNTLKVNESKMTLNGSFYESSTFSLGGTENEPWTEFDTSKQAITVKQGTVYLGPNEHRIQITEDNVEIVGKTLTTNGKVTVNNNMAVNGAEIISSDLNVGGNILAGSNVDIEENCTIAGALAVSDTMNVTSESVNINKPLTASVNVTTPTLSATNAAVTNGITANTVNAQNFNGTKLNINNGLLVCSEKSISSTGTKITALTASLEVNSGTISDNLAVNNKLTAGEVVSNNTITAKNSIEVVGSTSSGSGKLTATGISIANVFSADTSGAAFSKNVTVHDALTVGGNITVSGHKINDVELDNGSLSCRSLTVGDTGAALTVDDSGVRTVEGQINGATISKDSLVSGAVNSTKSTHTVTADDCQLHSQKLTLDSPESITMTSKTITFMNTTEFSATDATAKVSELHSNTKLVVGQDSDAIVLNKDGNITATGQITANNFDTTSDIRLKENIQDFIPAKSILDLPVKSFSYKNDPKKEKVIGCIAQDLQEICPEIVHANEDGMLSINESKIVYLLLDEVKKLKAEVEQLKAKE